MTRTVDLKVKNRNAKLLSADDKQMMVFVSWVATRQFAVRTPRNTFARSRRLSGSVGRLWGVVLCELFCSLHYFWACSHSSEPCLFHFHILTLRKTRLANNGGHHDTTVIWLCLSLPPEK